MIKELKDEDDEATKMFINLNIGKKMPIFVLLFVIVLYIHMYKYISVMDSIGKWNE